MDSWQVYSAGAKFALYIATLGAVGICFNALLFKQLVSTAVYRRCIILFAISGMFATLASFLLRGASLLGNWSGALDPEILGILWETPVGSVIIYRLVGFTLILAGMLNPSRGLWLAVFGGILVLCSFTQIGHVADRSSFLIQFVLLQHLAVASFWIGVLIPLSDLARDPKTSEQAGKLGHRFGQVAAWLIPSLLLAGVYLTWQLVGGFSGFASPYGLMLLAKLLFVVLLLGLGAANKFRFVPALMSRDPVSARHLSNIIVIEGATVLAVLAATALLTSAFSPLG